MKFNDTATFGTGSVLLLLILCIKKKVVYFLQNEQYIQNLHVTQKALKVCV